MRLARQGLFVPDGESGDEKGAVYLLGLVTREQAANAVEAARKVRGVLRVVKVFEYRD